MAEHGLGMPSGAGGLMRYNEEYDSALKFTPSQVVLFIIGVTVFVVALKIFFPLA